MISTIIKASYSRHLLLISDFDLNLLFILNLLRLRFGLFDTDFLLIRLYHIRIAAHLSLLYLLFLHYLNR